MKINKTITLTIFLSVAIAILPGCRGAGKYADDIGYLSDDVARAAQKIGRQNHDQGDDIARGIRNHTDDISHSTKYADEVLKFTKQQVKNCAEEAGESAAITLINTAISSGYSQISLEYLLDVSKNAIQECTVVKLGKAVHDALLNESAASVVSEVTQEYQGKIEFVLLSSQPY